MKKVALLAIGLNLGLSLAATPNDTLVYMVTSDIDSMDIHILYDQSSGRAAENVIETLVGFDGARVDKFKPVLAQSLPVISNNGKTYTFTLRKNVKFQNGDTFDCQDAKYSFQRALVTNYSTSAVWFLAEPLLGTTSNAKDDKSVTWAKIDKAVQCNSAGQLVFNLVKVDPSFLSRLTYPVTGIISKEYAVSIGEWNGTAATWQAWVAKDLHNSAYDQKPIGTGAYQLVQRTPDRLVFRAFPGYWGGEAKLKNVILQNVKEETTMITAMQRGDADYIALTNRQALSRLRGVAGVTIYDKIPKLSANAIFMNEKIAASSKAIGSGKLDGQGIPTNFFSDINVRQGFNYAFDFDRHLKEILTGNGEKRTMLLPSSFLGYDVKVPTYSFDMKKAEESFKKAFNGQVWNNGFTMKAYYVAGTVDAQLTLELLKKNIEAINPKFKLQVEGLEWPDFLETARAGNLAMQISGWGADFADPTNFLYTFYHSKGVYYDRVHYSNPQMDKLLEQGIATTDVKKRQAIYSQVGRLAYNDAVYIIIPVTDDFAVLRSNVKGFVANPMIQSYVLWKDLSK